MQLDVRSCGTMNYLQTARSRRYQQQGQQQQQEEEEEEEDDEVGDEEVSRDSDGDDDGDAAAFEGLSSACGALLKKALVAQVSGQLETAVQVYLMTFKLHPAAAPKFRDEFMQVLKLHCGRLAEGGRAAQGVPLCRLAVSVLPHDTEALTLLGRMLFLAGEEAEARRQWQAALRTGAPDASCVEARESLDSVNARAVNRWHYRMINDAARNSSYADALQRAVHRRAPDDTAVLDIGAGTGLLAMYAARCAENSRVVACEMSGPMAEIARDVLSVNQMKNRVDLLSKHSDDVHVGADVSARVQVIVTETADCGLLGESMMPSLKRATQQLLAPGGQTIPCKADVHALLVHSPMLCSQARINDDALCGVVLPKAFSPAPLDPYLCEYLSETPHARLSEPFLALTIPFGPAAAGSDASLEGGAREPVFPQRTVDVAVTETGSLDAIVMWYDLWLDDAVGFSTSPLAAAEAALPPGLRQTTCWEQAVFVLQSSVRVVAGQTVRVTVVCEEETRLRWQVEVCGGAAHGEVNPTIGTCGGGRGSGGGHADERVQSRGSVGMAVADVGECGREAGGFEAIGRGMVVDFGERIISLLNDQGRNRKYLEALEAIVRKRAAVETQGNQRYTCLGSVFRDRSAAGPRAARVGAPGVHVLDLCQGWSVTSLLAIRAGAARVLVVDPPAETRAFDALVVANQASGRIEVWRDSTVEDAAEDGAIGVTRTRSAVHARPLPAPRPMSSSVSRKSVHERLIMMASRPAHQVHASGGWRGGSQGEGRGDGGKDVAAGGNLATQRAKESTKRASVFKWNAGKAVARKPGAGEAASVRAAGATIAAAMSDIPDACNLPRVDAATAAASNAAAASPPHTAMGKGGSSASSACSNRVGDLDGSVDGYAPICHTKLNGHLPRPLQPTPSSVVLSPEAGQALSESEAAGAPAVGAGPVPMDAWSGWDVLVVDAVDPGGMLRQGVLEDVRLASELILSQGATVVPAQLTVRCMCVESSQLLAENRVNPPAQGGLDVSLLDRYSVRSLMSLDLRHVALKALTPPADVLILELLALSEEYAYEYEWIALEDGRIDAIAYWFLIGWAEGVSATETLACGNGFAGAPIGQKLDVQPGDETPPHWRQAAWMLEEGVTVHKGSVVRVRVSCIGSYLSFKILS